MRRVLVIGAAGLLGSHLYRECALRWASAGTCFQSVQAGFHRLDIRDTQQVHACCEGFQPDVIILAGALTHVDYCETHPEESLSVNVRGAGVVADVAAAVGATLVFFSTDYVFDGAGGPYAENDLPHPLNVYGQHKLQAEEYILKTAPSSLVIRTSWLYGHEPQGKNFIARLTRNLSAGQTVPVPSDQIGSPTYVPYLGSAVIRLIEHSATGLYHAAGADVIARDAFARLAARTFHLKEQLILGTTTESLHQPALRPLKSGLDSTLMRQTTGLPEYTAEQGLCHMRDHKP